MRIHSYKRPILVPDCLFRGDLQIDINRQFQVLASFGWLLFEGLADFAAMAVHHDAP